MTILYGCLLWSQGLPAETWDVTFEKIVEPDLILPNGGQLTYGAEGTIDGDRVSFRGDYLHDYDWETGIWMSYQGDLEGIVDTETLIPGSVVHFSGFGEFAQDTDRFAFFGEYPEYCDIGPCGGIYVYDDQGYTLIANTNDTVPGQEVSFGGLWGPAIDASGVAFGGGANLDDNEYINGIYADFGAGLVKVADSNTAVPDGSGYFDFPQTSVFIDENSVFFYGQDTDNWNEGYYGWDADKEQLFVVVDGNSPVPGSSHQFKWFSNFSHHDGTLAFEAELDDFETRGVYGDLGQGLELIADQYSLAKFGFRGPVWFDGVAAGDGAVGFVASDDGYWTSGLFLYRDGQLSLVISEGDQLDGKTVSYLSLHSGGVSGDSIVFNVEFADTWQQSIYVAKLHRPKKRMIGASDLNGNGFDEVIILRQQSYDHNYFVQVRDVYSGAMTAMIDVGPEAIYDIAVLEDMDAWLLLLKKRADGRPVIDIFDLTTGIQLKSMNFLTVDMLPVAVAVVPDMNDNSASEIAVLATLPDGSIRIQIRDSANGASINTIKHNSNMQPLGMHVVNDFSDDESPEVVLLGIIKSNQSIEAWTRDAGTGNFISRVKFGYAEEFTVYASAILEDLDGSGSPELMMSLYKDAVSRAAVSTKDLMTRYSISRVWLGTSLPLDLSVLDDVNSDGKPDVASLMVDDGGSSSLSIIDAMKGAIIDQMPMQAIENAEELTRVGDISFNGMDELAVLGEHFESSLLEIRDCHDEQPLRFYFVP
jgi:hypothetical protein